MSELEHPNPNRWWKHRRRGFYIGIWWGIAQTFMWAALELYQSGSVAALAIVVGSSYGISIALIVAYYSNNAIENAAAHLAKRGQV